ncbi:MAG: hypothetical protein KF745_15045 [Phycisphaeraceae bacterium]|nr:hypothetical protein [Phycisphaeraceae bacterium]
MKGSLLGAAGLVGVGAIGSGVALGRTVQPLSKEQRDALTPEEIIARMKAGNERFRSGRLQTRDFLREQRESAAGQYPKAVILSCIDSRAPAEIVMDMGIGEVFNSRMAGNIANADVIGGIEFGCKVSGAKVLLVMGHTACGAIKGAIDNATLGNLTGLLAKIRPAVEATEFEGDRTSKNPAFVDAVARKNVSMTIDVIRAQSPVLDEMERKGTLDMVGAMYNLETAQVEFFT